MNESIFRKKSIDRISSPEDLTSYMKVANPGIWLTVGAIIIILIGAIIWGIFGRMESTVNGVGVVSGGKCVCFVSESQVNKLEPGQTLRIGNTETTVEEVASSPVLAEEGLSAYAMHMGSFSNGEYVYPVTFTGNVEEGNYNCVIVIESVSALSFLWN